MLDVAASLEQFAGSFTYELATQTFVERPAAAPRNRQLATLSVADAVATMRRHGLGALDTIASHVCAFVFRQVALLSKVLSFPECHFKSLPLISWVLLSCWPGMTDRKFLLGQYPPRQMMICFVVLGALLISGMIGLAPMSAQAHWQRRIWLPSSCRSHQCHPSEENALMCHFEIVLLKICI